MIQLAKEKFLDSKRAAGRSPLTVSGAAQAVNSYLDWAQAHDADPTAGPTVTDWRISILETHKPSTAQQYFVVLKDFFRFCAAQGWFDDPVTPQMFPKMQRKRQVYANLLTTQEIAKLLDPYANRRARPFQHRRNYAIMTLFLTTSIRNTELRLLKVKDILWDAQMILIENGKGGHQRFVSAPQVCLDALRDYLAEANLSAEDHLFTGRNGEPISRESMSELVRQQVLAVTGRDGVRSHALRHASASYMLTAGVNLKEIQEKLGHADYKTTEIYAQKLEHAACAQRSAKVFDELMEGRI